MQKIAGLEDGQLRVLGQNRDQAWETGLGRPHTEPGLRQNRPGRMETENL